MVFLDYGIVGVAEYDYIDTGVEYGLESLGEIGVRGEMLGQGAELGDLLSHSRNHQIMDQAYGVPFEIQDSLFVHHPGVLFEMEVAFHFNGVHRCDRFQPVQARGNVDISSMEDRVHTLERFRDLWRWFRPNTGVMCVGYDAYFDSVYSS